MLLGRTRYVIGGPGFRALWLPRPNRLLAPLPYVVPGASARCSSWRCVRCPKEFSALPCPSLTFLATSRVVLASWGRQSGTSTDAGNTAISWLGCCQLPGLPEAQLFSRPPIDLGLNSSVYSGKPTLREVCRNIMRKICPRLYLRR